MTRGIDIYEAESKGFKDEFMIETDSNRIVWKDFVFDPKSKKELARYIATLSGSRDKVKFETDKFLAEAFGIYYVEGFFNPYSLNVEGDSQREFRGGDRLRQRMLEIHDCDNEKCQRWLAGQHERSERFSRKQIHTWITESKDYNSSQADVADLKNSAKLTEFGVDLAARPALRRICDSIRKASANGSHHTYYSELTYNDLTTLQWLIQGYPELKIFDQLAIMDVYQALETEGRDTSNYDDWLSYRTWESDSNMDEYIEAVENRVVRRIGVFYSRNFPRPLGMFRYHLPTQLIDLARAAGMEDYLGGRDTDVLGVDTFDVFEIFDQIPDPVPMSQSLYESSNLTKTPSTLTLLSNYLDRRRDESKPEEESPPLQKIEYDQFGNPIKPWEK